jgi:hypothetical protein
VPGAYGQSQRPPSPTDIANQMSRMPGASPAEYLNMQQQRGALTAQDTLTLSKETIRDLAIALAAREKAMKEQGDKTDQNENIHTPLQGGPGTESAAQRVQRGMGIAEQVMNEMGPGGSTRGRLGLGVRGIQWAAKRFGGGGGRSAGSPGPHPVSSTEDSAEEAASDPTGGERPSGKARQTQEGGDEEDAPPEQKGMIGQALAMFKKLPVIGQIASVALAGYGAFEAGGKMVQGARNIGSIRGGGGGEGAQVMYKAQMLAMNPFITQDQARQIYQSVMSEGYADASGSGADNVIDFMKHNLTSMNISVAESTKMLRSTIVGNAKGDPDSVAGAVKMLQEEMDQIRTLSRGGVMSQPDYRQHVEHLQDQLIRQGVSPQAAARQAMEATQVGSERQDVKGQFEEMTSETTGSMSGSMGLVMFGGANVPAGLDPEGWGEYLGEHDEGGAATENMLKNIASRMYNMYQAHDPNNERGYINAVVNFQRWVRLYMPDSEIAKNRSAAKSWYNNYTGQGDKISGVGQARQAIQSQQPAGLPSSGGQQAPGGSNVIEVGQPPTQQVPAANTGDSSAPQPPQIGTTNVQISLTPDAARLLEVLGPKAATVSTNKQGANRGMNGYAPNATHVGPT